MNSFRYQVFFMVFLCGCATQTPTPRVTPQVPAIQPAAPAQFSADLINASAEGLVQKATEDPPETPKLSKEVRDAYIQSTTDDEFQRLLDADIRASIKKICYAENKPENQITYFEILGAWKFNVHSAIGHYARERSLSTNLLNTFERDELIKLLHDTTISIAKQTRTLPSEIPKDQIDSIGIISGKKLADHYKELIKKNRADASVKP